MFLLREYQISILSLLVHTCVRRVVRLHSPNLNYFIILGCAMLVTAATTNFIRITTKYRTEINCYVRSHVKLIKTGNGGGKKKGERRRGVFNQ